MTIRRKAGIALFGNFQTVVLFHLMYSVKTSKQRFIIFWSVQAFKMPAMSCSWCLATAIISLKASRLFTLGTRVRVTDIGIKHEWAIIACFFSFFILLPGSYQAATFKTTGRSGGTCSEGYTDLLGYPSNNTAYNSYHLWLLQPEKFSIDSLKMRSALLCSLSCVFMKPVQQAVTNHSLRNQTQQSQTSPPQPGTSNELLR